MFEQFKSLVEHYFSTMIQAVYTYGSGLVSVISFLWVRIHHLKSPSHNPEHDGIAEREHRHVVETALTLLHHAYISLKY